uniref:Secreted protein n=1 Tax=Coccidioides posadasii RMSCC 3488 TaxID=454284 RepID=A0A0J6FM05_COCPO|nr:hypothetical protein CPAG_07715 [Coccidioides posadasii RMSCC 3488]
MCFKLPKLFSVLLWKIDLGIILPSIFDTRSACADFAVSPPQPHSRRAGWRCTRSKAIIPTCTRVMERMSNLLTSTTFHDVYQLARLAIGRSLNSVAYWANHEPPPRAETHAQVQETCQSWCLRVIRRLTDK